MQRHPKIKTIRLYPDVLGCILDWFTCGEAAIPDFCKGNDPMSTKMRMAIGVVAIVSAAVFTGTAQAYSAPTNHRPELQL